jgi:hypothetical protein
MEITDINVEVKKKKGRPKKIVTDVPIVPEEPKKRGRKKKEKPEEPEIKQKKKRGRKAAVKYITHSLRKKIPLTTTMQDNDKAILHLDIKSDEHQNELYIQSSNNSLLSTVLESLEENEIFSTKIDTNTNIDDNINDNTNVDDTNTNVDDTTNVIDDTTNDELDEQNLQKLYDNRIQSRIEQDNMLISKLKNLHDDENLLNKVIDKINIFKLSDNNSIDNNENNDIKHNENHINKKAFILLENFLENKEWIEKCDVHCWWCCHKFNTVPIGIPEEYNERHKKFRVFGVFCSFGCSIAYGQEHYPNYSRLKTLSAFLYKKLTGGNITDKNTYIKYLNNILHVNNFHNDESLKQDYINGLSELIDETLEPAPPRYTLQMFGGQLTINEFRNKSKERKIFKRIAYPMVISRNYVEEIDLSKIKNINSTVFNTHDVSHTPTPNIFQQNNTFNNTSTNNINNTNKTNNTSTSIDKFLKF